MKNIPTHHDIPKVDWVKHGFNLKANNKMGTSDIYHLMISPIFQGVVQQLLIHQQFSQLSTAVMAHGVAIAYDRWRWRCRNSGTRFLKKSGMFQFRIFWHLLATCPWTPPKIWKNTFHLFFSGATSRSYQFRSLCFAIDPTSRDRVCQGDQGWFFFEASGMWKFSTSHIYTYIYIYIYYIK